MSKDKRQLLVACLVMAAITGYILGLAVYQVLK